VYCHMRECDPDNSRPARLARFSSSGWPAQALRWIGPRAARSPIRSFSISSRRFENDRWMDVGQVEVAQLLDFGEDSAISLEIFLQALRCGAHAKDVLEWIERTIAHVVPAFADSV